MLQVYFLKVKFLKLGGGFMCVYYIICCTFCMSEIDIKAITRNIKYTKAIYMGIEGLK